MFVVDQHIEVFEEILAEDALNVEFLEVIHQHFCFGNRVGAGFEQVQPR